MVLELLDKHSTGARSLRRSFRSAITQDNVSQAAALQKQPMPTSKHLRSCQRRPSSPEAL